MSLNENVVVDFGYTDMKVLLVVGVIPKRERELKLFDIR